MWIERQREVRSEGWGTVREKKHTTNNQFMWTKYTASKNVDAEILNRGRRKFTGKNYFLGVVNVIFCPFAATAFMHILLLLRLLSQRNSKKFVRKSEWHIEKLSVFSFNHSFVRFDCSFCFVGKCVCQCQSLYLYMGVFFSLSLDTFLKNFWQLPKIENC